jgi:hypothetical protein
MTEVRRHQRTVDGRTVNVRHHTRSGTGTAAEKRQDAWEDRAAQRWTPPPRGEASDTLPADETWWDDDVLRPEAWTANDDQVEHEGHVFKVNRAPAPPPPQGDYDFAEPDPPDQDGTPTDRKALKKTRKKLLREQAALSWKFSNEPDRAKREAMQAQFRALNEKLKAVQDPRQVRREERAREARRNLYEKLSGE